MASFTVEGVAQAKNKEMQQAESAYNQAEASKQAQRTAVKTMEFNMKRSSAQQEKNIKSAEARLGRILEMKIERRFQAFPFLRDRIPPLSPKATLPEKQETDEMQKLELNLQGSEKRLRGYLKNGSNAFEAIWGDGKQMTMLPESMRFNLKGFGSVINSPQFLSDAEPLIMETVIEYPEFGQLSLPMRWAECMFSAMMVVHQCNTNPMFKKLFEQQAVPENEIDEEEEETESEDEKPAAIAK
jgi:hypothetical protein